MTAGTGDVREWLETNGLGGYAMSTATGENTRRYHGLLVAATKPPLGRFLLLSKLEETLVLGGRRIDLSTNRFPGAIHPEGFRYLTGFSTDPFPTFTWNVDGVVVEKEVFLPHGENAVCVTWRLKERGSHAGPIGLEVRPLVAFRDLHALTHENGDLDRSVAIESDAGGGCVRVKPYGDLPELFLAHDGKAERAGDWYRSFEYEEEERRGFDFREDLWHPLTLSFSFEESPSSSDLRVRREATVIASISPRASADIHPLRESELTRREELTRCVGAAKSGKRAADPFFRTLVRAADQFLVARGEGSTVIAGYPWFSDWGRDTMIALPGLTLAAGRPEIAKQILLEFARHVSEGMLPNRFPDVGSSEVPEYNTVDATLWWFEAIRAYVAETGDLGLARTLYPVLADVVAWHVRGTRYGIRVDEDGLLEWHAAGEALTWMDARVDGRPITPRQGKPVEIQALWFNALRTMQEFAGRIGEKISSNEYASLAEACRTSFLRHFSEGGGGGLADAIDDHSKDSSIRPNQILAVSVHHSMAPKPLARRVLAVVEEHLLTPMGLRTLSPRDPAYRGRYDGDPAARDSAYHQGTVWPWLLGPYVEALLKTHGRGAATLARARAVLAPLRAFVLGDGLGQIPEVFDGDAPHRPGGCPAQAWSVSELLRAALLVG